MVYGTEFTSKHFDAWAYQRGIKLDFIHPGKPVEDCFIESLYGRVRDECLNAHWFQGLDNAEELSLAVFEARGEVTETMQRRSTFF